MLKALTHLQVRLATRDRGATAVEYALMVALIAVLIVGAVGLLKNSITAALNSASAAL